MNSIESDLRQYFRSKTQQLLAASKQVISGHAGLHGSHREQLIRIYLNEILPKRFTIGRGMVIGPAQRSQETDIVVWNSHDYLSLHMQGHNLFFGESVRAVLEVKSTWSTEEFNDILEKCHNLRRIYIPHDSSLHDQLSMIETKLDALTTGFDFAGILRRPHHIATGAIIFHGGQKQDPDTLLSMISSFDIDVNWPDIFLLLEAGQVIVKHYEVDEDTFATGTGILEFIDANEDALLLFTTALLNLVAARSFHTESSINLRLYLLQLFDSVEKEYREFKLTGPPPGRTVIW